MSLPAAPPGDGIDASALTVRTDASVPVLELPADQPFEALRSWLRAVLPAHSATVSGRSCRLDFGTRDLVLLDLRRLVGFLAQEFAIEVTGLYVRGDAVTRFAERELKLKLFPTAAIVADPTHDVRSAGPSVPAMPSVPAPPPPREPLGRLTPVPAPTREEPATRTLSLHRTLRSGTQVRFDGDIHVYGDVNPGAHVVATGNVHVYGALKGVAHAGAHGDVEAFIVAFDMRPTQLRIARRIAIPSPNPTPRGAEPEIATIRDEQVVVSAFSGRVPR